MRRGERGKEREDYTEGLERERKNTSDKVKD